MDIEQLHIERIDYPRGLLVIVSKDLVSFGKTLLEKHVHARRILAPGTYPLTPYWAVNRGVYDLEVKPDGSGEITILEEDDSRDGALREIPSVKLTKPGDIFVLAAPRIDDPDTRVFEIIFCNDSAPIELTHLQ